jgi:predicted TIM-barrel fold metal-dependent hydrolase
VPNDEASVTAAVAQFPDRFYGYFMVDPQQPDLVTRIDAAARNRHLHAICLFPAMHRVPITDARLIPVLELATQHHLSVFVHCGALSVGIRHRLGLPSPFDMRLSNPLDLHPVANRFPQVRFVIPHFGAGMLRETLMLADLCSNIWLDTSSTNKWMAYEGLDLRAVYRRAIEVVGAGRLLFGTDSSFFPRGWHAVVFEAQVKALYELGIEAPAAIQIFGGNLQRLHMPRVEAMKSY